MSDHTVDLPGAGPTGAQPADSAAGRFLAAWQAAGLSGPAPRLEDYLADADGPQRDLLLLQLIALDVAQRHRRGEMVLPRQYLERFPDLDATWLAAEIAGLATTAPSGAPLPLPPRAPSAEEPTLSRPVQTLRCPHCHNPITLADDHPDEVLCPGCGSSFRVRDARHTDTRSGSRQVGKFRLLERVGVGAFGAVWRARDTQLDREVALKIPHTGLLTEPAEQERI
jgi:hypothetical protein